MPNSEYELQNGLSGAASRLLSRQAPAGYVDEWTNHIAVQKTSMKTGVRSAAIFRVGSAYLGLPSLLLQEVAQNCRFHSVPHKHSRIVRGIVNVRGELLLCISLSNLLGFTDTDGSAIGQNGVCERLLVCSRERDRAGFPVSEVCAIHSYHEEEMAKVPATLARSGAVSACGVLRWNEKTVVCLDDDAVFTALRQYLT